MDVSQYNLEAGQMNGWIYDATVCPGWEVNGAGNMSVDTPLSSATAVPKLSVNTLMESTRRNILRTYYLSLLSNFWRIHEFQSCSIL